MEELSGGSVRSSTGGESSKKRRLSDAVEAQDTKRLQELAGIQQPSDGKEEILTPEEAQRRTDELIAKLMADEQICDEHEYEEEKKEDEYFEEIERERIRAAQ